MAHVWSWKDEQLQQAWWTLVCCHYETIQMGCIGL